MPYRASKLQLQNPLELHFKLPGDKFYNEWTNFQNRKVIPSLHRIDSQDFNSNEQNDQYLKSVENRYGISIKTDPTFEAFWHKYTKETKKSFPRDINVPLRDPITNRCIYPGYEKQEKYLKESKINLLHHISKTLYDKLKSRRFTPSGFKSRHHYRKFFDPIFQNYLDQIMSKHSNNRRLLGDYAYMLKKLPTTDHIIQLLFAVEEILKHPFTELCELDHTDSKNFWQHVDTIKIQYLQLQSVVYRPYAHW